MTTVTVSTAILQPVVALVLWSCVMWFWMYATRIPAIAKSGMKMDQSIPNGVQMSQLPPAVRWKADNYNHLMEQPTLFYALTISMALLGLGSGLDLTLAWAYVGIRILHSLLQVLWNKIEVRFMVFVCSSLVLIVMAVRTALHLWA